MGAVGRYQPASDSPKPHRLAMTRATLATACGLLAAIAASIAAHWEQWEPLLMAPASLFLPGAFHGSGPGSKTATSLPEDLSTLLHDPLPPIEQREHYSQLCIHSYYAGELDAGRRACEALLQMPELPLAAHQQAQRNRAFYSRLLSDLLPSAQYVRLHDDFNVTRPGWSMFNPSIIPYGREHYLALVRSSNYKIVEGYYVHPPEDANVFKTDVIALWLRGADLGVERAVRLAGPAYERIEYPVDGLEDARLNDVGGGRLLVSATVRNAAPYTDGHCRMGVAELDAARGLLSNLTLPPLPTAGTREKNWMPIQGRPAWLYSCWHEGQTVVARLAPEGGGWELKPTGASHPAARGFRGGSQLVALPRGGWLALVHEVAPSGARGVYEHRFVRFDGSLRLVSVSTLFAFRQLRGVEFSSGLARRGGELVATFGVGDAEAWAVRLRLEEVLAMVPLPARRGAY